MEHIIIICFQYSQAESRLQKVPEMDAQHHIEYLLGYPHLKKKAYELSNQYGHHWF